MKTYAIQERAGIDLTLSENPLGPSPEAVQAILRAAHKTHLYPHEEKALIAQIAAHHNISEETILLGAGANQLLEDYLKIYALGKTIVVPAATFPESVGCMAWLQGEVKRVPLNPDFTLNLEGLCQVGNAALLHLCNPNNPTGIWCDQIAELALSIPLLISEAGADFTGKTLISRDMPPNLIVVRSFSKAYGLAGLRIGYSVAAPEITKAMQCLLRSYRVTSLAIAAASAALSDQAHLRKSIAYILQEKNWLMEEMARLHFEVIPSQGQNFIAQVPPRFQNAHHFCAAARQRGIAVVNCALYAGMERYIRISPQKKEINQKFIKTIGEIC